MGEAPPSDRAVTGVVEHFFRQEWGKAVAILTRIFGIEHLEMAEDAVQEALARAVKTWPFHGIPENPSAWIIRVARNLALDQVRRESNFRSKEESIADFLEPSGSGGPTYTDEEIQDDRLRLVFVCCHPEIPADAQIALALKTLCGFGVGEIASAFLTTEAAIAKRLTRAKQRIREAGISFEIPAGPELTERLESVRQTLYLLFNEGYKASGGNQLIREELCEEAMRLTTLLAASHAGDTPETHALLALMLLNAARLSARIDSNGEILLLADQDRSRWNRGMIARGIEHLERSATGGRISPYHLQAGIAASHCTAPTAEETDWSQILEFYDQLVAIDDSPVIALNRAVALANVHGAEAGLTAAEALRERRELRSYYLLYAVLGELEARLRRPRNAAAYFRESLARTELESERRFLKRRLAACEAD